MPHKFDLSKLKAYTMHIDYNNVSRSRGSIVIIIVKIT